MGTWMRLSPKNPGKGLGKMGFSARREDYRVTFQKSWGQIWDKEGKDRTWGVGICRLGWDFGKKLLPVREGRPRDGNPKGFPTPGMWEVEWDEL